MVEVIKFMNGEEIITEIKEETEEFLVINTPIGIAQSKDGATIVMYAWNICAMYGFGGDYKVYKHSMAMRHQAPPELEAQYIRNKSGLMVDNPDKQLII